MQIHHPIFYPEMLLSQMEVLQTCLAITRKEISPQTKQGNHCIESSVSKSSLTMPLTIPRSVSQSTLNIPTITLKSVSQSPLTKEKILEVYTDIFDGLGTLSRRNHTSVRLKENYVPARHAPRKVPIYLQDDFHAEDT